MEIPQGKSCYWCNVELREEDFVRLLELRLPNPHGFSVVFLHTHVMCDLMKAEEGITFALPVLTDDMRNKVLSKLMDIMSIIPTRTI